MLYILFFLILILIVVGTLWKVVVKRERSIRANLMEYRGITPQQLYDDYHDSDYLRLTALQKEDHWRRKYEGKEISWVGYVEDVDSSVSCINVKTWYVSQVKTQGPEARTYSIHARFKLPESEEKKLLPLKQGAVIRFSGKIKGDDISGNHIGSDKSDFFVDNANIDAVLDVPPLPWWLPLG